MKFIVKSERLEHKDQIIELDFSELKVIDTAAEAEIIIHLAPGVSPDRTLDVVFTKDFILQSSDKYEGKSVYGKYLGLSRIDGFPMFQIDTFQLDREEKISEILK
jgi:hypothetical protein